MTSMIERVARGIWEAESSGNKTEYSLEADKMLPCTWEEYFWKEIYLRRARAAILAMREPTEGMLDAKYGEEEYERVSGYLDHLGADQVWQAMIDDALAEDVK